MEIPRESLWPILLVLALASLSILLLRKRASVRRLNRADNRERLERMKSDPAAHRAADELMVQLEEFARRVTAQVDSRFAKLEQVIRDADERTRKLEAAVERAAACGVPHPDAAREPQSKLRAPEARPPSPAYPAPPRPPSGGAASAASECRAPRHTATAGDPIPPDRPPQRGPTCGPGAGPAMRAAGGATAVLAASPARENLKHGTQVRATTAPARPSRFVLVEPESAHELAATAPDELNPPPIAPYALDDPAGAARLHDRVREMAAAGTAPIDIAEALNLLLGEVELILNLRTLRRH